MLTHNQETIMASRDCRFWLLVSFLPAVTTLDFIDTISQVGILRGGRALGEETDRFYVTSQDPTICSNGEQIMSEMNANCTLKEQTALFCNMNCTCLTETPSFIESEKICSDEGLFKEGCSIAFGSYSFNGGWDWDTNNDLSPSLDMVNGYGFMSAFNVSTSTYTECSMISMELYDNEGQWNMFNNSNLRVEFFKQNLMWHISLDTESLTTEKSSELEGKFARLHIRCSEEEVVNGILTSQELSSCSIIKIGGNRTYNYTVLVVSSTTVSSTQTATGSTTGSPDKSTSTPQESPSPVLSSSPRTTTTSTNMLTVDGSTTKSLQKSTTTIQISPSLSTISGHHSTTITIHPNTTLYPPTVSMTSTVSNTTRNNGDIGVIVGSTLAVAFIILSVTAIALITHFSQSYKKHDLPQSQPSDGIELYNIGLYNRVQST